MKVFKVPSIQPLMFAGKCYAFLSFLTLFLFLNYESNYIISNWHTLYTKGFQKALLRNKHDSDKITCTTIGLIYTLDTFRENILKQRLSVEFELLKRSIILESLYFY